MVANHGIFQGYYFFHHLGLNRNMRDQFADSAHYDHCEEFCRLYDQTAFDADYDSEPLQFFEPMVERVFARPRKSVYKREEEPVPAE